jgi:hypothetical protein
MNGTCRCRARSTPIAVRKSGAEVGAVSENRLRGSNWARRTGKNQPAESSDLAGARSGGKSDVSSEGEAYEVHD